MTRHQLLLAFLYFFVLLVILPVFCSNKVYSVFYQEDPLKNQEVDVQNREHRRRGVRKYLSDIIANETLAYHRSLYHQPILDNLIVVIAKKPEHEEDRVLSQIITEIDRSIREQRVYRNALVVCNVTRIPFEELQDLARYYPVLQPDNSTKWKLFNSEEIIRHDFMDCVNLGRKLVGKFKHITVIRDVVVPYGGFLTALNEILNLRLTHNLVRGELVKPGVPWLFLHLHEPVPFRQYEWSADCVHEVVLLAFTGGLLFYLVFRYLEGPQQTILTRVSYILYGALYFVTFSLVVGRPYITELRRFAGELYRIYDPPEPVHFSALSVPSVSLPRLLGQLNRLRCSIYSPFHEALDHMINTLEMPGYVVSPSLVRYTARLTTT